MGKRWRGVLLAVVVGAGVLIAVRCLLGIFLPFLVGAGLALCAEPVVALFSQRMRRGIGATVGVSIALCVAMLVVFFIGAVFVRELGVVARIAPDLEQTAKEGITALSGFLQGIAARAPGALGSYLSGSIANFLSGGTALLDRALATLLRVAGGVLRQVPDGALGVGTAVISAYMISAKLPQIRKKTGKFLQTSGLVRLLPALRRIRTALWGWLRAQLKLSGVTYVLVTLGLCILRVPYAPIWAAFVAVVDAFPILGTGTVLVPWSVVCFLQGNVPRAIGLLGVYAVVTLMRSILEPKIVGKQLGIDPLVTLFALYTGYRIWGIGGMILAPMLTAAARSALRPEETTGQTE